MIVAHYVHTRGSYIAVPLDFSGDGGETLADVAIEAWLRHAGFQPTEVTDDMEKVAEFAVEPRGGNAGWFLTIGEATSATFEPGFYLTDIRITAGGNSITSDRLALIEITLPVTGGV